MRQLVSSRILLGLIVLSALGLRVWGINFGLPYLYHYDEHFYINTALKLGTGVLHNPPYAATGFSNALATEYGAYYIFGKLTQLFNSAQQFEDAFRTDPSVFYLLGRVSSALFGTLTVLLAYVLGKALNRKSTGLLAAALLAFSFLYVRDSHYSVPDIGMACFVAATVALSALGLRQNQRRWIYLGAVVGGIAVSMKWTAIPVFLVVLWASMSIRHTDQVRPMGKLINRTVALSIILFALGFALTSPQILLNPAPYVREAVGQAGAGQEGGFEFWQVDTVSGWAFYAKTLAYGLGVTILILAVIGLMRRIYFVGARRDTASLLVILFPLTYYLLMGSTSHYFARYALPLVPFAALFAAEVIVAIFDWLARKNRRLAWITVVALFVVAVVPPLIDSVQHDMLLTRTDTRTLAMQWIEANLPSGTKIAADWRTHTPDLSTPDRRAPGLSNQVYEVEYVGGTGLSDHTLDWYRQQGFDYLITSSFIDDIPLIFPELDADRKAFYASLQQQLPLVKEFSAGPAGIDPPFIFDEIYGPAISLWQRERPGPTIKIYQLASQ